MVKLGENLLEKNEEMYYWSHFLKDGEVLQDAPPVLKEAQTMLDEKIWEFEEERIRDARALGKQYMEQKIEEGREEGKKEGIEQGIEQGREESVLNIYKKNQEVAFISDILSLPEEKVREILKKHQCI